MAKIFTAGELKYCRSRKTFKYPELAVRFAAKEAYSKAIGTGIAGFGRKKKRLSWKSIEVVNNARGKPLLAINKEIDRRSHVSLSHSRDYAVASVYVEK